GSGDWQLGAAFVNECRAERSAATILGNERKCPGAPPFPAIRQRDADQSARGNDRLLRTHSEDHEAAVPWSARAGQLHVAKNAGSSRLRHAYQSRTHARSDAFRRSEQPQRISLQTTPDQFGIRPAGWGQEALFDVRAGLVDSRRLDAGRYLHV